MFFISKVFDNFGTTVGNTPLHNAAREGDIATMQQILKPYKPNHNYDPQLNALITRANFHNQFPTHLACMNGHHEAYKFLLPYYNSLVSGEPDNLRRANLYYKHTDVHGFSPVDYLKMYIKEKQVTDLLMSQNKLTAELKEVKTLMKEKSIELGKAKSQEKSKVIPAFLDNIERKQKKTPALPGNMG